MMMDRRKFVATMAGGVAGSMVLGISNAQAGADLANNADEKKKAMADIVLRSDNLLLHLDKKGGAITGFGNKGKVKVSGLPCCVP